MKTDQSNVSKGKFGDVLHRELPVLYRVAKRITRRETDAEDLVGQTLFLAHKNWGQFDGRYVRSWLIRIMRNEWQNQRRKAGSRPEVELESMAEPSDEGFWWDIQVQIDAKTIIATLDELPDEYREAVTLCDVEEMSYEEAAEALGVPVGTIKSRLFRGRKLLRSKLAHLNPHNPQGDQPE
jgi:RNA polymerase sigma-70 factor (ECF subfamily)